MIVKSKTGMKANTCSFFENAETNPKQESGKTNIVVTTVIRLFEQMGFSDLIRIMVDFSTLKSMGQTLRTL